MPSSSAGRIHDRELLDALEIIDPIAFSDPVWRVTRKGRDALQGSAAHGRWSLSGEFEVLYTSAQAEGAVAEIGYRLSLEPVWPSRLRHELHKLHVATSRTLQLVDMAALEALGIDVVRYASFDYSGTQAVASAAHFLAFDGLLVPSARAEVQNLVLFLKHLDEDAKLERVSTEEVDWTAWRNEQ